MGIVTGSLVFINLYEFLAFVSEIFGVTHSLTVGKYPGKMLDPCRPS